MSKCYDGALVMPESYAVINAEEMTYVEGGENIGMTRAYLKKSYCEILAQHYIDSGWTNVTTKQLKKEIYGHAYAYYNMTSAIVRLKEAGISAPLIVWATKAFPHLADGVDIEDAVDRYQIVWNVLWNF